MRPNEFHLVRAPEIRDEVMRREMFHRSWVATALIGLRWEGRGVRSYASRRRPGSTVGCGLPDPVAIRNGEAGIGEETFQQ